MKIIIYCVVNPGYGYGVPVWIKQVATRLADRGHDISILTTKYGNQTDPAIKNSLVDNGVEVIEFNYYEWPLLFPRVSSLIEIAKLIRKADVTYFINQFFPNDIFLYLLKKFFKLKVVSGFHSPVRTKLRQRFYHKVIDPFLDKRFDAQHVLTRKREESIRSQGCENVYRIPNGVDITKFKPITKPNIFTVIFVGRLVEEKGVYVLSKVIEHLNRMSDPEVKFLVFGTGPLSYVIDNLNQSYPNVERFEYVNLNRLVEAYQSSHLLLFPSYSEEFPITVLEAQASGVPVVANNLYGLREEVTNGVNGLLVNYRSEEFLTAILYFKDLWYNKREEYDKYSLNARKYALNYDWDIVIDKIESMFTSIDRT